MNSTTCAETTRRRAGVRRPAVVAIAALACAILLTPNPPVIAKAPSQQRARTSARSSDLIRRQRDVAAQKRRTQEWLRIKRRQEQDARSRLHVIYTELRQKREALVATKSRLQATRRELRKANDSLDDATSRLNHHRRALSARLVAFYERGTVQFVDVLARASSFSDFANRMYLVQSVVNQDLDLMHAMDDARRRVNQYRNQVQARERQVSQLKQRAAIEHSQVASLSQEKAQEVQSLARAVERLEDQLAQCDQEERSIAAMLRRIQRTSGRARWAQPWTGHFLCPCRGSITSGFGMRMHPILHRRIKHQGVDISAPTGTPIHAADSGTVVFSGVMRGYGQCIVIDHGGGMSTLYGHCSRRVAANGRQVRKGDLIGYVGSTGMSTGPHLHFGALRNGVWVNPLAY